MSLFTIDDWCRAGYPLQSDYSLSGKNSPACWLITTQQFIYNIPQ